MVKTIQCRIQTRESLFDLALLHSDMYRAYLILDMLTEDVLHEISLKDLSSSQQFYLKKSKDHTDRIEDRILYLSDNEIQCIQELISQCHRNPYNAAWLHYDIEVHTPDRNDAVLCVHLASDTN